MIAAPILVYIFVHLVEWLADESPNSKSLFVTHLAPPKGGRATLRTFEYRRPALGVAIDIAIGWGGVSYLKDGKANKLKLVARLREHDVVEMEAESDKYKYLVRVTRYYGVDGAVSKYGWRIIQTCKESGIPCADATVESCPYYENASDADRNCECGRPLKE